jgi:RpiR family carbohydrate utilization transcriptional regulator
MVSAPRLTSDDVLLVLSFSGRTSYLISNIEIAKKAGARLIAISPSGSLVASLADQNINLNAYRSSSMPGILPTGRAPMYVMLDVIFALLAQKLDLQPQ